MDNNNSNIYENTHQGLNINNFNQPGSDSNLPRNNLKMINNPNNIPTIKVIKEHNYDERFLFYEIGNLSFATATLLLAISTWDGFKNKMLLTVFGFFFGALGQLITAIYCFKEGYYIDGTEYFFFTLNWCANTCFDIFTHFGWMQPLGGTEYGFLGLMGCMFVIVFFIQSFNAPSKMLNIFHFPILFGFVFNTIGNFCDSKTLVRIAAVCNIITAALSYYFVVGSTLNARFKKVYLPILDGNNFLHKL